LIQRPEKSRVARKRSTDVCSALCISPKNGTGMVPHRFRAPGCVSAFLNVHDADYLSQAICGACTCTRMPMGCGAGTATVRICLLQRRRRIIADMALLFNYLILNNILFSWLWHELCIASATKK
jgi:hypothetical protein